MELGGHSCSVQVLIMSRVDEYQEFMGMDILITMRTAVLLI